MALSILRSRGINIARQLEATQIIVQKINTNDSIIRNYSQVI